MTEKTARARPRYTNTNSSEAIERNEAGGPFSTACGNGMGIAMKTNLLLLAILYLLGTSSFAASNPFDDASAAYERGDYV
ncbi:MAG: hypothetical protein ACREQO_02205, partial [Candidatus Binatia bacterium]